MQRMQVRAPLIAGQEKEATDRYQEEGTDRFLEEAWEKNVKEPIGT
jgi:hypothetical protein